MVGGGVAGLETVLALSAFAGPHAITLVTPESHFAYRPLAVATPFGGASVVRVELAAIAADRGFVVRSGRLAGVDLDGRTVALSDGATLAYDDLVVAVGARRLAALEGALTFRGPEDVRRLRDALAERVHAGGGHVLFVAGAEAGWTLPLYELALMTARWASERRLTLDLELVTTEPAPLDAFGAATGDQVRGLLAERGIALRCGATPAAEDLAGADLVVALPRLRGVSLDGLPHDAAGFVPVDEACRVRGHGHGHAYVIGDLAAGPVKQGGLATQQADTVAARIAGLGTADYTPRLRAMLFTGDRPLMLQEPAARAPVGPVEDGLEPWWPPHKIVAEHLGIYLATHGELLQVDPVCDAPSR